MNISLQCNVYVKKIKSESESEINDVIKQIILFIVRLPEHRKCQSKQTMTLFWQHGGTACVVWSPPAGRAVGVQRSLSLLCIPLS